MSDFHHLVRIEGVALSIFSAGTDFTARRFRLQDRCNKTCKSGFYSSLFLVCVIHQPFARELARLEASIYIVGMLLVVQNTKVFIVSYRACLFHHHGSWFPHGRSESAQARLSKTPRPGLSHAWLRVEFSTIVLLEM